MKKNLLKRIRFKNLEKQNRLLKMLHNNTLLDREKRSYYAQVRHSLKSKSSLTVIRKSCIETYRNRGLVGSYRLSRYKFKKQASQAFIPGLRKV